MKSNNFNYSLLAVGVAAVMGISTGAMAATATDTTKAAGAINNVATASYSVGTVVQPTVTSNNQFVLPMPLQVIIGNDALIQNSGY